MLEVFLTDRASRANYNIKINGQQTTYGNFGFETVFKVDEIQTSVSGMTNHRANVANCEIITFADGNSSVMFSNIVYKVTNNDVKSHTISIATHADIAIATDDRANIYNIDGNKGFTMIGSSRKNISYVLRGMGGEDVDTYWYGHFWERHNNLYKNCSFQDLTNTDSAMAFSWKDRIIKPNETKIFTIASSASQKLYVKNIPKIKTQILSNGPYRKQFNLTNLQINITDDINDQNFTIKCNFNNVGQFVIGQLNHNKSRSIHNFDFKLPQEAFFV